MSCRTTWRASSCDVSGAGCEIPGGGWTVACTWSPPRARLASLHVSAARVARETSRWERAARERKVWAGWLSSYYSLCTLNQPQNKLPASTPKFKSWKQFLHTNPSMLAQTRSLKLLHSTKQMPAPKTSTCSAPARSSYQLMCVLIEILCTSQRVLPL